MGRFFVRITIVLVAIYLSASYIAAQFYGVDILRNSYMLMFEACTLLYVFEEGKYHCRFMKWTMLGVFISDCISHADYYIDFISVEVYNLSLAVILFTSFFVSCILAIRHFRKVRKLKKELNEVRQRNSGED